MITNLSLCFTFRGFYAALLAWRMRFPAHTAEMRGRLPNHDGLVSAMSFFMRRRFYQTRKPKRPFLFLQRRKRNGRRCRLFDYGACGLFWRPKRKRDENTRPELFRRRQLWQMQICRINFVSYAVLTAQAVFQLNGLIGRRWGSSLIIAPIIFTP